MCRRSGLERKRRCGWLKGAEDANAPLVWARRSAVLRTCPKSYITAESQTFVEEFFVRRRLGAGDFALLSARQVEAFVILEKAVAGEISDAQQNTRQDL